MIPIHVWIHLDGERYNDIFLTFYLLQPWFFVETNLNAFVVHEVLYRDYFLSMAGCQRHM